jgi:5-methylcytosine-specific restriction endonuclease McrA
MSYPKSQQTTKSEITKKVCDMCHKNRDIKFFSSKRAYTCGDCKRKKWNKAWRERPAAKNKSADTTWAKAVKERDGFKCVYCGSDKNLNSHHLFSRRHQGLRWDLENGITLCAGHHNFSTEFSAHKTPLEFAEWVKELKGDEWYQRLLVKAKQVYKAQE